MPAFSANVQFLNFYALDEPDMNLIWLDDFLALAATGNFSRAADERHSSQPAFSRRIRAQSTREDEAESADDE